MNDSTAIPAEPAEIRSLRTLIHAIAISLLIVIGTLFVFLYRQVVVLRKQTVEMSAVINDYERSNVAEVINEAGVKLAEFSQQNPDFLPIYMRYFGTNAPAAQNRSVAPSPASRLPEPEQTP